MNIYRIQLFAALFFVVTADAQQPATVPVSPVPGAPAIGQPAAQEGKKTTRQWTAGQNRIEIARKLLVRLEEDKVPWQFYENYALMFKEASEDVASLQPKSDEAKKKQLEWIQYCDALSKIMDAMIESQKTIDGIRLRNTTIPQDQRETKLKEATRLRSGLVMRFGDLVKSTPPGLERQLQAISARRAAAKLGGTTN